MKCKKNVSSLFLEWLLNSYIIALGRLFIRSFSSSRNIYKCTGQILFQQNKFEIGFVSYIFMFKIETFNEIQQLYQANRYYVVRDVAQCK